MKILIIALVCAVLLTLAFLAVFLLRRTLYNMIDRRIERFQSELIEKQVREIQNMYKQVRGWRHDYRNHIQNMKIQLAQGNYAELEGYLDSLADDLTTVDTVIKTGINVKANIPNNIPLSDVELCAVLGNLLDNAAEACAKLPESDRFMRIYIGCLKNQLYMSVQNSAGDVKKIAGHYLSTKQSDGEHGYGIFRIDRVAKKYGGYVNRQNEEGVFATEIMVPLCG